MPVRPHQVEKGDEVLMMAKTRTTLLPHFTKFIQSHHSYEVPETIAASIVGGNPAYLTWLRESTRAGQGADDAAGVDGKA
jgi:periplasmic divalent cation tolerance protein